MAVLVFPVSMIVFVFFGVFVSFDFLGIVAMSAKKIPTSFLLQFDEKKFENQTREQPMLARLRELNRQTSGKNIKNAPV